MTRSSAPPQSVEAEASTIGAMLVSEGAVESVLDEVGLTSEDFLGERNKVVFECIEGLRAAKRPVDELTVSDALAQAGLTDQAGGKHYVSELAAKVPAAGNAKHYAEIVRREVLKDRRINLARQLADPSLNGEASDLAGELLAVVQEAASRGASTLTNFADIIAKPVHFLWRDRIALAKLTALAGRPKIGKGLFYSHLIAAVTRGTLDGDLSEPRCAIIVTTEDEPGDTLKPRLMAADADLSLVSYFTMGSEDEPIPFRVPQDAEELGRRVEETNAALVVIDPLIEFIDGKTDSHKSQPVRQAVAALNAIARQHNCAVLTIFHLNKGVSTDPLLRHEGSAAFTQIVRAGLMLGFDPDDPEGEEGDQRVLAVSSSNLAKLAPSLAYRISGQSVEGDTGEPITTAAMGYIGESTASSHELLGAREDEEQRTDRDEATEFLAAELADGPKSAKAIKGAAKTLGITEWPLKAAKKKLHVASQKNGMDGGWMWSLPEGDAGLSPSDHVRENASPSSPSASRAKSAHPLQGDSPEGDAPVETSPSSPCRYPDHRASDYIGEGGRTICGVCHPKAGPR